MNNLLDLSKPGLVALEDHAKKQVWIFYSADILGYLSRLLANNKKFSGYSINILEPWFDRKLSQVHLRYYYDSYEEMGFVILNKNPRLLLYSIRVEIIDKSTLGVYLFNRWHSRELVGVFSNMQEAKPFLDLYEQMKYILPMYAINKRTREYIET